MYSHILWLLPKFCKIRWKFMFITLPFSEKRSYCNEDFFFLKLTSQNRFLDAQYSWQTISIFPCCVYFLFQCQHITKFLGKAFKPDQKSQPRPRMIASEWVFRYLEIYVLLPRHQKILTLVVCWQGFMLITYLMAWLYANQESDYATHHGRSPRYVLKNWLTSEQRNIITHILDFLSFF